MLRFFVTFIILQLTFFAIEQLKSVQHRVIIPFTEFIARISTFIIQFFDDQVYSHGIILQRLDNSFSVSIQAGCNGVEAVIVLTAAILAFPSGWKAKLVGIGVGFIAVEALNILRIISLFYIGQWDEDIFTWAHLYLWQALIMLDVLILFLVWLRFLPAAEYSKNLGHVG